VYDPGEITDPHISRREPPQEVYEIDTLRVVTSRFFEFANLVGFKRS
jgi:hypothetical protein